MSDTHEHARRLQESKDEGDLASYQQIVDELEGKSDDELRHLAEVAGVDGAATMSRAQLIERLLEEPGANEA